MIGSTDSALDAALHELRLHHARTRWRELIAEAQRYGWSHRDLLTVLAREELSSRRIQIVVEERCRWVQVAGTRIDLQRRWRLRRVCQALIESHRLNPADWLSQEAIFQAGWPGESALPDSMRNRVHVSVCRLRSLGLGEALESDPYGFRIRPEAVLV